MGSAGLAAPRRERPLHRVVDWLLAVVSYPLVALFTMVPGAVREDADGLVHRSPTPSLAIRLFPQLLPDQPSGWLQATQEGPAAVAFALVVLVAAPGVTSWAILHRRVRPQLLLSVAVGLLLLLANIVPAAIALYSYAAWFTDRRRLVAWSAAAAAALVVGLWGASVAVPLLPMAIATPLALGLWIGTRRQLLASLRERADRLEREQHLLAERAANAERHRIAREMHDVVAHRVSLMVVHAGGLEVSARDPSTVETATLIRETGREAMAELRDALGVLHDDEEVPTAPQPTLAELPAMLERWRAAGIRIDYQDDAGTVPTSLQRTIYRVVQEALTNAGKHAPGAPVAVRLESRAGVLVVSVENECAASSGTGADGPPGYGLAGLRERVAHLGGGLHAGPRADGGWRVYATLPVTATGATTGDDGPEVAQ